MSSNTPIDDSAGTNSLFKSKLQNFDAQRFAKYLVGGTIYFWIGYAVFAICYSGFHWYWLWAKALGDVIGWTTNYFIQRYWAFADHVSLSEMEHASRYLFIESIGFVIDYLLIGGLRLIGISPYFGFMISGVFFTFWSYLWYKYWVFPETGGKPAAAERVA